MIYLYMQTLKTTPNPRRSSPILCLSPFHAALCSGAASFHDIPPPRYCCLLLAPPLLLRCLAAVAFHRAASLRCFPLLPSSPLILLMNSSAKSSVSSRSSISTLPGYLTSVEYLRVGAVICLLDHLTPELSRLISPMSIPRLRVASAVVDAVRSEALIACIALRASRRRVGIASF